MKFIKINNYRHTMINLDHVRRIDCFKGDGYDGYTYYLKITYTDGKFDEFDLQTGDNELAALRKVEEIFQ